MNNHIITAENASVCSNIIIFSRILLIALGVIIGAECFYLHYMIRDLNKEIVEINYVPCEGYEYISGIMPEDILEMDGVERDICLIAQTVWGEARGCTDLEKTQVIWCIFNRVDDPRFPDTIEGVVTAKNQFYGYKPTHPIDNDIYKLVVDTYLRWSYEGYMVYSGSGRTLDKDYIGFHDDKNGHLIFTKGC